MNTPPVGKTRTDALGQVTTYSYFRDDNLKQRAYSSAVNPTPPVSFTYDFNYDRVKSMTDGTGTVAAGTTTYAYFPIGVLGAGRLQEINGTLGSDLVRFEYDELGRMVSRSINNVSASVSYDALGRVSAASNPLGAFAYGYEGPTGRLTSANYPNGQSVALSYFGNTEDRRLQQMRNLGTGAALLSKFDYTYDPVGNIKRWTQESPASSVLKQYTLSYDPADQLTGAVVKNPVTGAVTGQLGYSYDAAGNRTVEQRNSEVVGATHNGVNQLAARADGGLVRIAGTTDEPADVTVNGQPAVTTGGGTQFDQSVALSSGTNNVTVAATDPSGNQTTRNYFVTVSPVGSSQTLTYDLNGNLRNDGTRQFDWDAENRLIRIIKDTHVTEMEFSGVHERVRMVEKDNGVVSSDKRFIWSENEIREERAGNGTTTNKRFYDQGVRVGATSYFYTRDHLGSIREVTNNSDTVVARYDYDLSGRRTKVSGTFDADFGFTGHYFHAPSELNMAIYRVYDADIGRWLSRDPIGETGGINLYGYVANNPVHLFDPFGLSPSDGIRLC